MSHGTLATAAETEPLQRGLRAGWLTPAYLWPQAPAGRAAELSREARLLRDALGIAITALPGGPVDDREALRQYVRALNDLIVGPSASSPVWKLLRDVLSADALQGVDVEGLKLGLGQLWSADELPAIEALSAPELEAEWLRRVAGRMPRLAAVLREEPAYAELWKDMPGGDFDTEGRGRDYTAGMRAFPACRALGVQALMALLGADAPGERVYLDVLGGEGYVWRLLEAQRQLAFRQVIVVSPAELGGGDPARLSPAVADLLERTAHSAPGAAVLAVYDTHAEPAADGSPRCAARLLRRVDGRPSLSATVLMTGGDVVRWLRGESGDARGAEGTAAMITNDVSRHMFYRAGLWGMTTREDALELQRTYRAGSLDGVLCAYGTHHIPGIYRTIEASRTILRPGGCLLVHDFFDRGPVGTWFHDVVDPYSKTGHDMPHIGPVEMAAYLFRAGFRDVELVEIDDPFIFTAEPDDELGARDLSLRYVMGMYGMTESFGHRLDELEGRVREILTYPELGQAPVFDRDYTLIPRRAIVARGFAPLPGSDPRFSERDAALIQALARALSASTDDVLARVDAPAAETAWWFGADGFRWGLSPEDQAAFLAWHAEQAAAGTLG